MSDWSESGHGVVQMGRFFQIGLVPLWSLSVDSLGQLYPLSQWKKRAHKKLLIRAEFLAPMFKAFDKINKISN
jgi:hypothetical protein